MIHSGTSVTDEFKARARQAGYENLYLHMAVSMSEHIADLRNELNRTRERLDAAEHQLSMQEVLD